MANAIPMLEGTQAAGGYLVPDNQNGLTFDRGLARESAVLSMPGLRRQVVNGKREKYAEYVGRPAVSTVAEGADKPATGAELAEVTLDIVKAAGVVMLTEELVEDAQTGNGGALLARIDTDIRAAFADWIDANALGRTSAGTITGAFNSELSETTQTVELGTTGDAFAVAVSNAMALVEAAGYSPTGIIAANDVGQYLRNARTSVDATKPVFYDGFSDAPAIPNMYGLPVQRTTNLQTFAGTAAAGRVVAVIGDFTQALFAVRNEVRRKVSTDATVDVGGTQHRLWQQNKLGVLWEMRAGFVVHDLNRAFVAITNAA
jgi:HK97 family phage major capsid protein